MKPETLRITSVSYNVLLSSTFGVLRSTETKTLGYVFLVLKSSTLASPRGVQVNQTNQTMTIGVDYGTDEVVRICGVVLHLPSGKLST